MHCPWCERRCELSQCILNHITGCSHTQVRLFNLLTLTSRQFTYTHLHISYLQTQQVWKKWQSLDQVRPQQEKNFLFPFCETSGFQWSLEPNCKLSIWFCSKFHNVQNIFHFIIIHILVIFNLHTEVLNMWHFLFLF